MTNDCGDLKENGCVLESFEKNVYFYGKLISARDMTLEQRTNERKLYTINRMVLGSGLVCGLKTSLVKENDKLVIDKDGNVTVAIEPGLAIDGCGRLIVVSTQYKVTFPANRSSPIYFYIKHRNCLREAVPVSDTNNACQENCCYNRIREVFEVVSSDNDLLQSKEIAEKKDKILEKIKTEAENGLDIAQAYYEEMLQSGCAVSSELVLLGVFKKNGSDWVSDLDETYKFPPLVYDNIMLYDIIKILNKRIDDLSTQKPQVEVPDVICKDKPCKVKVKDVEKTLQDHKLVADEQPDETETDDKSLVGCIYKQDPVTGQKVDEGSKIKIWAYKEKQAVTYEVPDVVKDGKSINEDQARKLLQDKGILNENIKSEYVVVDKADPYLDMVISQNPTHGNYSNKVENVTITVNGLKAPDYADKKYQLLKVAGQIPNDGYSWSNHDPEYACISGDSNKSKNGSVKSHIPDNTKPVRSKTVINFVVYDWKSNCP